MRGCWYLVLTLSVILIAHCWLHSVCFVGALLRNPMRGQLAAVLLQQACACKALRTADPRLLRLLANNALWQQPLGTSVLCTDGPSTSSSAASCSLRHQQTRVCMACFPLFSCEVVIVVVTVLVLYELLLAFTPVTISNIRWPL